jgi:hypothetical protein
MAIYLGIGEAYIRVFSSGLFLVPWLKREHVLKEEGSPLVFVSPILTANHLLALAPPWHFLLFLNQRVLLKLALNFV